MAVNAPTSPSPIPATAFGGQTMTGKLLRAMVRTPCMPSSAGEWQTFGYRRPVDHERALAEHAALVALLEREGVEVVVAADDAPGDLDAIFAYDPSLMTDEGAILLRMGKSLREAEPALHARTYREIGLPVLGKIVPPGRVEGGDTLWLDVNTLAVGRGYRTNTEGIAQLRSILAPLGITVLAYDLPHWDGPGECLHLMSFISPIAPRAALVHKPLMAVSLVEELVNRDWTLIDIEPAEFDSMACNVVCLEPYRVLAVNGNPRTRRILEASGCTVIEYRGDEISHNRSGGPTCLFCPILRQRA